MTISTKTIENLLRHKHYKAMITYLRKNQHPIINDLEYHLEHKEASEHSELKIEHIQLSDEDIDGLTHELQTLHLEKRLRRLINFIVGIGALLIALRGVFCLLSGDYSCAYLMGALPVGLILLYFAWSP